MAHTKCILYTTPKRYVMYCLEFLSLLEENIQTNEYKTYQVSINCYDISARIWYFCTLYNEMSNHTNYRIWLTLRLSLTTATQRMYSEKASPKHTSAQIEMRFGNDFRIFHIFKWCAMSSRSTIKSSTYVTFCDLFVYRV